MTTRLALASIVLFIAGVLAAARVSPDDWPLFRGNRESTGVAAGPLPADLDVLWKVNFPGGSFESTAAIVDGVVYLADFDGTLVALALDDGRILWQVETGLGFAASPAVADGRLFIGDLDGTFYCFDTSGKRLWTFTAQAEIDSAANFYRDTVLFGSQDATLYCLEASNGQLRWKLTLDDQIRCTPTVVGNRTFVAGCDARLHVIDLDRGQALGAIDISQTGVTPAASGDRVFCGTQQGGFFAADWKAMQPAWHFATDATIQSSPAVTRTSQGREIVIFGTQARQVLALDGSDGKLVWSFTAHAKVDSSPVVAGDRVVIAGGDGRLYLLAVDDGRPQWERSLGGGFAASPAISRERLVIATQRGVVYCLGAPAPSRRP